MKKTLLAMACILFVATGAISQQLRTPSASPSQKVTQEFGLGSIELEYGRPSAKNREVFGKLVPFDAVWRTGANAATKIKFSDDVKFGGKDVKAGQYGLLTIPGKNSWTVILSKDLNVTSPSAYKQENDVVRVMVNPQTISNDVETFTIQFSDMDKNNAVNLELRWAKTKVVVPITVDLDSKIMGQIDQMMNKDNRPYFAAASYYYENGKDLAQAAQWVDKAMEANQNAFWMPLLKARIHQKLGNKAEAVAAAQKTIELATKAQNSDYVTMANDLINSLK